MRKPLRATAAFAAAALFVGLNATASVASTRTWSVSPGGAITGTAAFGILLEDRLLDVPVFGCTSSALKGSLKSGQGLQGGGIGMVTSVTFGNCTGQTGTFTITTGRVRWPLTTKYVKAPGVTEGRITKIHFVVSNSGCSFVVDGTSATARDGWVSVSYTNSTDQLKISPYYSHLHMYKMVGCRGLAANRDTAAIPATYPITPGQTITSP